MSEVDRRADLRSGGEPTGQVIAHGTKVTIVAQFVTQVVRLLTNIVLARLLTPHDFGLVAIATVVTALLQQLKDLGTGSAIVQAKRVDHRLLNAVFYLNAGLGLVLAGGLALLAGPIAIALGARDATGVLLALCLATFLSSIGQIHHALLRHNLQYRAVAVVGAASAISTTVVAVVLALLGFGVWALVIGTIMGALLDTVLVWRLDRWRPTRPTTDFGAIRPVLGYSISLFLTNLVTYGLTQGTTVIVSRGLGTVPLGQFSFAQRTISAPAGSVTTVAIEVMFPAFSRLQDNDAAIRDGYLRSSRSIALVTFPAMAGLAALAVPLVQVVLGARWIGVVPLVWVLAPVGALQSVTATYSELLMAKGRTDLNFRFSLVSGLVILSAEAVGLRWGLVGVAVGYALATLVMMPLGLLLAFRRIGMSFRTYVTSLLPTMLATVLMLMCVLLTIRLAGNGVVGLIAGVAVGVAVYAAVVIAMRFPAIGDLLTVVRARRS